ncbi:MAG: class I SAM-dependent methyltransferase, partial [Ktedonobacteraceae bacterium]
DLSASEFPARAAYYNHFEQLRDTSHTRALPLSEFMALFTACGLEVEQVHTYRLAMPLEAWLANAHTSPERATRVRELIEQDMQQDLSGTHPLRKQETIYFHQCIATIIARKISAQNA